MATSVQPATDEARLSAFVGRSAIQSKAEIGQTLLMDLNFMSRMRWQSGRAGRSGVVIPGDRLYERRLAVLLVMLIYR
jgi:hypothetical protein